MKPRHGGGPTYWWSSPDDSYKQIFEEIGVGIAPDPYPGILIISNNNYSDFKVYEVRDCMHEIDQLMDTVHNCTRIHWHLEQNSENRREILNKLTSNPKFIG